MRSPMSNGRLLPGSPIPRQEGAPRDAPLLDAVWLALLLLSAALLLPALLLPAMASDAHGQSRGRAQAQIKAQEKTPDPLVAMRPGEEVVIAKCLHFSVRGFTDRSSALDHFDWVNVKVRNSCDNVRRHLLVELVLIDPIGRPYGGRVWVLERGERLWPGRSKIGNFAVPDPDDLIPVRWAVRVLKLERPRTSRRSSRGS